MKFVQSLSLLLPLLVEGAAPLQKRQWPDLSKQWAELEKWLKDTVDKQVNSMKKNSFKIEELKPTLKIPGVKSKRFIHGPYTVYGLNSTQKKGSLFRWPPNTAAWQNYKQGDSFSLDEDGTGYLHYTGDDFLSDITALKVETGILTKDLKRAETRDGIYNHHNLWFDLSKSSAQPFGCDSWGGFSIGEVPATIFAVGGAENIALSYANPTEGPNDVKTGFYIAKNRLMMNMIDVVNYAKEDQKVYQFIDVEYLEGKPKDRLDVVQVTFDPFMCNQGKDGHYTGIDIKPKPGQKKWTVNAGGIAVSKNGYLVSMRGHLHDGGSHIIMRLNGNEICKSKAMYGGPGHTTTGPNGEKWETINEMTNCQYATKVRKGDKIAVEATYDLELHPSRLIPSNSGNGTSSGGGGHAGHGPGKSGMKVKRDGGEGEQMALFSVYFAPDPTVK